MIAPLTPYAIKGALWYQGETPCPGGDAVHRRILTDMITDWRTRFESPDSWFLIVQLPVLGGSPTMLPGPLHTGAPANFALAVNKRRQTEKENDSGESAG